MKLNRLLPLGLLAGFFAAGPAHAQDKAPDFASYPGKEGPGKGHKIVFLAGDEEYRSEEALPMLAKILSQRHGFDCSVLFSLNAKGEIAPNEGGSLSHPEALDSAEVIIMSLRFRNWSDETMKRFDAAYLRGVPMVAMRTSTHAFNIGKDKTFARYSYNAPAPWQGGFGKQVLGETWVNHWARHKVEATNGIIEKSAATLPLFNGVASIFGKTDVYEAAPPADATILVRGQVLKTLEPGSGVADYRKKAKGVEQGINDPMMPVVWTREIENPAKKTNRILTTTMGSADDLQSEGLRRLVVNGVFWGLKMDIPAKANVDYVDPYEPLMYGFDGYRVGLTPADHALGKKLPAAPTAAELKKTAPKEKK